MIEDNDTMIHGKSYYGKLMKDVPLGYLKFIIKKLSPTYERDRLQAYIDKRDKEGK